jgi:tetratricopeptide (TPR) repeat protein
MIYNIFNRTIFLWAGAMAVALFIVDPREVFIQRLNTMNQAAIDCLRQENCNDTKSIAEAREYYAILAQVYPHYGRGFEMQGVCYLLLKQDDMAIKKFQEAIKHNPDLFWVSFELGKVYYRRGDYSRALEYFQSIISQDKNTLLKKGTLPGLGQFTDSTRRTVMIKLDDFITEIRLRSYQMALGCYIHQGHLKQAQSIVDLGLNDPLFDQGHFFILAGSSLGEEDPRKKMLLWIDSLAYSKPVFHPWGYVFQPLKEILYQ